MSQQREDVILEIATMLLAEQHERFLHQFHTHILFLEDLYFSSEQQKAELFEVHRTFSLPIDTYMTPTEAEGALARADRLLRAMETTCQEERTAFREEGASLLQHLAHTAAALAQQWGVSERRRQDDFAELCVSCQREVAALTAEVRGGVLSHFHGTRAAAAMEEALSAKSAALRRAQSELSALGALRLREAEAHQTALRAERDGHRTRLLALQAAAAERERAERETAAAERDGRRAAERRAAAAEREAAEREAEWRREAEAWRRRLEERDAAARAERLEREARGVARRVEEARVFREELVGAVRRRTASLTSRTPEHELRTRQSWLLHASSPVPLAPSGFDTPKAEYDSNPLAGIKLHTPTESYTRLMNLSAQLKRHIEAQ